MSRLKVYRCTKPYHPQPCWHTKCLDCGEVVTAFDFNEEESLAIAEGHSCPADEQLALQTTPEKAASSA